MIPWSAINEHISAAAGEAFRPEAPVAVGGGCINAAWLLRDGDRAWFAKTHDADRLPMFEAEVDGLKALAAADALHIPQPLCTGSTAGCAYLVMEFVAPARPRTDSQAQAGRALALLHQHTGETFGWPRDNWIGATPQPNTDTRDWVEFWRQHRLGYQLELAASNGHQGRLQRLGAAVADALPALLSHAPVPSLLHGDLWGGNLAFDAQGAPFVFDPAVYFGDREADLAMTSLFGGFDRTFHDAYSETWPLADGYAVRKDLYNLYHVLNHLNLFGGGYGQQAVALMERLLAETGARG